MPRGRDARVSTSEPDGIVQVTVVSKESCCFRVRESKVRLFTGAVGGPFLARSPDWVAGTPSTGGMATMNHPLCRSRTFAHNRGAQTG